MASSVVVTALSGIAATYAFLWALLRMTQDRREPPVVVSTIPFISPILGMVKWSMDFHSHVGAQNRDLPIYTLRLPGTRLYIVNSLNLITVVQRQWRTLLFPPIQVKAAQAAMGASKDAVAVMERDMVTEHGFINGMVKSTLSTISSGPSLDALNSVAFGCFDDTLKQFDSPKSVNMFEWIERQIMRATTDAIYGSANPMKEKENLEAWSKYHPALMFMVLDLFPQNIFFRAAVKGRQTITESFEKYYTNGSWKEGSAYIQEFIQHAINHQIPEEDIPRILLGTVFNNVANTIPSAFWVIYHVISDPVVLEECRNEIVQAVTEKDGDAVIDLTYILNSCPILMSTFQEVFRFHGMANSVRVVSEDHMLDDRYLIKKGGMVMISARTQHQNPDVYGENAHEFYHRRFVKQQGGKRLNPIAFRGFGGGTTMCPGRHFATSEILLLTALLVLRFDIRPKTGKWVLPTTVNSSQAEAMEQPDEDIEIEFVPRAEAKGKRWHVAFSGKANGDALE